MHNIARPNSLVRFSELCLFAAVAATTSSMVSAAITPTTSAASASAMMSLEAAHGPSVSSSSAASPIVEAAATSTLTITGTPAKAVIAGQVYIFQPIAKDAAGKTLTFSIANKPGWASFNTTSGALRGTPSAADVGAYSNILIRTSDGTTTVALPAFAVTVEQIGVKSATLSWAAPTENSDGSALTNLAGYRICYGASSTAVTHTITVSTVGITTYVVSNLSSGAYYFAIVAYNTAGVQSKKSNIVSAKL
jgi:hypothetical protein